MHGYWLIVVPYASARFRTEWHPTVETGPFSRLQRGAFDSEHEAILWARKHLNGTPYELRYVKEEPQDYESLDRR